MSVATTPQPQSTVYPFMQRLRRWPPLALLCFIAALLASCAIQVGAPGASSTTAPAQIERGDQGSVIVIVRLMIEGKGPFDFALDTGASESLVERSVARSIGLPVAGAPQQVTGIGGSQMVTPVKVAQWSLGGITLPSEIIVSAPASAFNSQSGVVGLLGSDVLSTFGSVTINYSAGSITVQ